MGSAPSTTPRRQRPEELASHVGASQTTTRGYQVQNFESGVGMSWNELEVFQITQIDVSHDLNIIQHDLNMI